MPSCRRDCVRHSSRLARIQAAAGYHFAAVDRHGHQFDAAATLPALLESLRACWPRGLRMLAVLENRRRPRIVATLIAAGRRVRVKLAA
jgi:hypothetical protein